MLWLAVVGWSLWAANSPGMGADATRVTYSGIVDERRFYAQATGNAHPLTAADYLDYPRMRAVLVALNNTPDGALLLPSGNYDQWDVVPAIPPPPPPPGAPPIPEEDRKGPHTVFFTNLGMLGHERRPGRPGASIRSGWPIRWPRTPRGWRTAGSATTRTCSRTGRWPRGRS